MNYIDRFLKSGWLSKAEKCIDNPEKVKELLDKTSKYRDKKGLAKVKDEFIRLCNYIRDVTTGKHKDYSGWSLTLIVASIIYVVSPLDIIPDFLVGAGLIDDVAIVLWTFKKLKEELDNYRKYQEREGKEDKE